jgi:type II/IV secretion system protein
MSASPFSGRRPLPILAPWQGGKDFTVFLSPADIGAEPINEYFLATNAATTDRSRKDKKFSYSDAASFGTKSEPCRALICPCFRGERYSITIRRMQKERRPSHGAGKTPTARATDARAKRRTGYTLTFSSKPNGMFLFDLADCKNAIWDVISGSLQPHTAGLVVVAGSTSSGKSVITRGLIDDYLRSLALANAKVKGQRRPHLVTYEDPIEKYFSKTAEEAQLWGFDYTPRQKEIDADNLTDVLQDCLRQTPAAVYAGETRDLRDWQALLNFASSGHLVFTTCHAGSLSEIITSIRDSLKADTTSKRSVLANRLLAVVHLKMVVVGSGAEGSEPIKGGGKRKNGERKSEKQAILPAAWLRTPAAINALTAEGPSVILPQAASAVGGAERYCYGRTYFADKLVGRTKTGAVRGRAIKREALRRDLEGL